MNIRLALFSCLRTDQTTAKIRHVFRVFNLPDRPPRFYIPRHFSPEI